MAKKNTTLMQYFEWYLPDDGTHWQKLADDAEHLANLGITHVWMPPAFKGTGTNDVGYGVYDLYDLGEFDQKGAIRTKYGTKEDYLKAISALKAHQIAPIADIVLNHKAQGDHKESFHVMKMDENDRQTPISEPYEIDGWTHFDFPGREDQYSNFHWHWCHFSGLDYDARNDETGIYMIMDDNPGWADNESVDDENGNYDYLMFCDINYSHPDVIEETLKWEEWFMETTEVEGFRLDAIKHIDRDFMNKFMKYVIDRQGEDFFIFGEYWNEDYETKLDYLEAVDYEFSLVDVKLHMNLHQASVDAGQYDLGSVLEKTLMNEQPWNAVTFVENHDTQVGQSLQSPVETWFKPSAYALILLMKDGFPTIFYGDYYGTGDSDYQGIPEDLAKLMYLRMNHAYGDEVRYFDDKDCIGFTRRGDEDYPDGLAVIMSIADSSHKVMNVGASQAGRTYVDYMGNVEDKVVINDQGDGDFKCLGGSVSVWVDEQYLK
ncbi:alpha-amylase [Hutsoniella sourekii]|uniref:alpha-amylase n=1 Tax=Hutsoniella sourekii TaxID=87650 RepID=UPI0004B9D142|nr:alpha-amylase [Hutsoniella sourekii]